MSTAKKPEFATIWSGPVIYFRTSKSSNTVMSRLSSHVANKWPQITSNGAIPRRIIMKFNVFLKLVISVAIPTAYFLLQKAGRKIWPEAVYFHIFDSVDPRFSKRLAISPKSTTCPFFV